MKLTTEEVKHIANLAKLQLNDDEVNKFQDELSKILEHYGQDIQKVDTTGVDLNLNTNDSDILRPDVIENHPDSKSLIAAASNSRDNLVKVPGVFE